MKRFIFALTLALAVRAGAQSSGRVVYGDGVPGVQSPDCTQTMVYINSLTADLYTSSGSPCAWGIKSQTASAAGLPYVAAAGSVNAMTATFSPAISSLVAGKTQVWVLPNIANSSTTPTLNASALGAQTITKLGGAALASGDYTSTAWALFIWSGTTWQLLNPQTTSGTPYNPAAVAVTGGTIDGTPIGATTPAAVNATGVIAAINGFCSAAGGYSFGGNANSGMWYQSGHLYFCDGGANAGFINYDGSWNSMTISSPIFQASPATAGANQVSVGGTTAAASNCNQGGTLSSVVGCEIHNVAGTNHYVPYF